MCQDGLSCRPLLTYTRRLEIQNLPHARRCRRRRRRPSELSYLRSPRTSSWVVRQVLRFLSPFTAKFVATRRAVAAAVGPFNLAQLNCRPRPKRLPAQLTVWSFSLPVHTICCFFFFYDSVEHAVADVNGVVAVETTETPCFVVRCLCDFELQRERGVVRVISDNKGYAVFTFCESVRPSVNSITQRVADETGWKFSS